MPIGFAGPLLRSSGMDEYRPLGALGQPAYLSHRKLVAALTPRLGPAAAHYLARPEIDETNRQVHWHAEIDGPVRRWADLPDEEQARFAPKVVEIRDGLLRFVDELEAREGVTRAESGFAHLVRQAVRSPGAETLYLVGDTPVLTLWGFEGGSSAFDTLTFNPVGVRAPALAPVAPVAAAAVTATRPWWHWLLLALLALLLLGLLFWALRGCEMVGDGRVVPERMPERVEERPPVEGVPDPALPRGATGPDAILVPRGDGTVEGVIAVPEGTLPDAGAVPGAEATPPEPPAAEPPAAEPPASEPPASDPPAPEQTPSEPPAPEQTPPEPPASEPPPAEPPPAEPAPQDQPLNLPPPDSPAAGPGSVGFLQGEWKSDGGLVDQSSGRPLDQRYRFDDQGQGQAVIRRADGSECQAAATATRTADGGLRIAEQGPLSCPDGSSYAPSVTECRPDTDGRTTCVGVNPDGSTYNVGISR